MPLNYREEMIAAHPYLHADGEIETIRRLTDLLESALAEEEWRWCGTTALYLSAVLEHAGRKVEAKATLQRVIRVTPGDPDAMLLLALSHHETGEERLALLRRARQIAHETNAPDFLIECLDGYLSES